MAALIAAVVVVIGTIVAIVAVALTVWHAHGMLRGTRGSAHWWVNLIPFIALALPGALDSAGELHRAKMVRWGLVSAVSAIVILGAEYLAQNWR